MKKLISFLALLACHIAGAQASAIISDLSYTDKSLSFTASGDLNGYGAPGTEYELSIVYTGNIYGDTPYQANQYSGALFSNAHTVEGNTGGYNIGYNFTWIGLDRTTDLKFSGEKFTISWAQSALNTAGTGDFLFYWGSPYDRPNNLISTVSVNNGLNIAAVPEPETYAMLLAGLGLLAYVTRGKSRKKAA